MTYEEPTIPDNNMTIDGAQAENDEAVNENVEEAGSETSEMIEPFTEEPDISAIDNADEEIADGSLDEPSLDQCEEFAAETSEEQDRDSLEEPSIISTEESAESEKGALDLIGSRLGDIADSERRIFTEIREIHKLYHTEFAGRLKSMQDELDQYRKIDKGRAYDDILAAIARIYGTNETLEDEVAEPKAKKSIRYMLLDLEELLETYGMSKLRSSEGEKRNPRHCQILNRIPTDNPDQHDTVAKSYNSGFYIGNRTVIKEMVDIYFYEERTENLDAEDNAIDKNVEDSGSE